MKFSEQRLGLRAVNCNQDKQTTTIPRHAGAGQAHSKQLAQGSSQIAHTVRAGITVRPDGVGSWPPPAYAKAGSGKGAVPTAGRLVHGSFKNVSVVLSHVGIEQNDAIYIKPTIPQSGSRKSLLDPLVAVMRGINML